MTTLEIIGLTSYVFVSYGFLILVLIFGAEPVDDDDCATLLYRGAWFFFAPLTGPLLVFLTCLILIGKILNLAGMLARVPRNAPATK
jgi:hypothetical protein